MNVLRDCSALTKIQAVLCVVLIASSALVIAYGLKGFNSEGARFSLSITKRPATFGEALYVVPNQRCLFLITVEEESKSSSDSNAVAVSATSPDCVVTVFPQTITPGQVAEVTVIPDESQVGENLTVVVVGDRGGVRQIETVSFEVIEEEDREATLGPEATAMRDKFIPWLSTEHPELGISNDTAWTGTVVNPMVLVVMHYMFLSENWEMYVTWHVMIPPYDWSRIYLRPRFNATAPTYAFEISSVQGQAEPQAIEVPDWV
jgi:hypothetical protein